jgi:hypothetical protein
MIEIRVVSDRFVPTLVCDHCGDPIEGEGNIGWAAEGLEVGGRMTAGPFSLHKTCDDKFMAQHPELEKDWLWDELDTFMWRLIGNARVDLDRGRQSAERMQGL